MEYILNRTLTNRTCCLGTLTSADGYVNLSTKEGRIPQDRTSYIKWCLPPGEYKFTVEYLAVSIGNKVIRGHWPCFRRVPWFPQAGLFTGSAFSACKGRIMLGTGVLDEFSITGDEEAAKVILRHCRRLYEDDPDQVHTLIVKQDEENLEVHDYTREEYERQQRYQQELDERKALMDDLYGDGEDGPDNE